MGAAKTKSVPTDTQPSAFNRCRFKGKCSLLHMVQPSNNKVLAGLKEDIAALKLDNFKLRAERLDSVKETEAKVLLSNKTGLDEVKEALAVANGVAEELKELKASLAPAMIRINEELKSQTTEQVSKMRDEVFNLAAQFQEINRDHASIKEELSNLKADSNNNDLKRTIKELGAKVENFITHVDENSSKNVDINAVKNTIKKLTKEYRSMCIENTNWITFVGKKLATSSKSLL